MNISEHKASKSQDTREITKQPQTKFKQPTPEEHVRNRPVNDLLNERQKSILDRTTTFSTYPPLVPTVLPFSTTPSFMNTILVISTLPPLPTPIPTKYKQPMTRQSAINRPDLTQNQQKEKVPIRKIVYSNPPPRPFASVTVSVGSSNPEYQEDVSRSHNIVVSNRDIISKPIYVMNRLVNTKRKKVSNKPQKQKPSSTIQLEDKREQSNEDKMKTDKLDLLTNISRVYDSNGPQLVSNQPYKPWLPINQDNAFIPIKPTTETYPTKIETKSLQYKTPKLLRHPCRNPANMVELLYTFNPSVGNSLSNPEIRYTRDGNQEDASTTTEGQATYTPQTKQETYTPQTIQATHTPQTFQATYTPQTMQAIYAPQNTRATYAPQTNRKDNHRSVFTIQQMQKNLLSLPQNNDVNDISQDSDSTIAKVTETDTLNEKTKAKYNDSKIRLSFNIPCARSARYDLILGFKFCV